MEDDQLEDAKAPAASSTAAAASSAAAAAAAAAAIVATPMLPAATSMLPAAPAAAQQVIRQVNFFEVHKTDSHVASAGKSSKKSKKSVDPAGGLINHTVFIMLCYDFVMLMLRILCCFAFARSETSRSGGMGFFSYGGAHEEYSFIIAIRLPSTRSILCDCDEGVQCALRQSPRCSSGTSN